MCQKFGLLLIKSTITIRVSNENRGNSKIANFSRFSNNFRENFRLHFRKNFRENGGQYFCENRSTSKSVTIQWIQKNSRYSGCRRKVDAEDTGRQWIQRIPRIQTDSGYKGYRRTVDREDTDGQWIERIQTESG